MNGHIVVIGSINMDLVVRAPRHPESGETLIGSEFRTFPGGKGANQAAAAARLQGRVKMIGKVGQDSFGDQLLESLAADGVDTTYITRDEHASTGVALITVDELGQETIISVPGANHRLTPEDLSAAEAAFEGAAVLLLQLESPKDTVRKAVELAKKHNLQIVVNPNASQELDSKIVSKIDALILNQTELAFLTGIESISSAAGCLLGLGIPHLMVTLGQEGAVLKERNREVYLPSYNVPVVDATGAGDAFLGAFAVALTEGFSYRVAGVWGNAAGAIAVTRPGAQPALPTREELADFLEEKF